MDTSLCIRNRSRWSTHWHRISDPEFRRTHDASLRGGSKSGGAEQGPHREQLQHHQGVSKAFKKAANI